MSFRTTIELGGKTATGFEVPAEVVEGLGAGRRPAVRVTINGYGYRSTIAPRGGRFMIPLSADRREAAGLEAGDEAEVSLELDTQPREISVPEDFATALAAVPEAQRFFDSLSYSRKSRYVLLVEGTKKPETRQRRIADSVAKLANGEG